MIRRVSTPIGRLPFSVASLLAAICITGVLLLHLIGCGAAGKVLQGAGDAVAAGALSAVAVQGPPIVADLVDAGAQAIAAGVPVVAKPILIEEQKGLNQVVRTEHTMAFDVEQRVESIAANLRTKTDEERKATVADANQLLDRVDGLMDRADNLVTRLETVTVANAQNTGKTFRDYVIEVIAVLGLVVSVVSMVIHYTNARNASTARKLAQNKG